MEVWKNGRFFNLPASNWLLPTTGLLPYALRLFLTLLVKKPYFYMINLKENEYRFFVG
jgi:hypothetical protein